ncbi:MAG: 30S ribosomal protein S16 [Deltaproteobacteria bacterium]|nr:30S ribosomal protein S16 [Deltaproteobacteria bacterium]
MAIKIRLARMGAKKNPYYRVVVAESQAKRDGKFIEIIGSYDPNKKPADVRINNDRLQDWLTKGAQPTETVASLIKNLAVVAPAAS